MKLEFIKRELSGNDIDSLTHENLYVRLAGVVKLWNVVQHSYPYFELYDIDWDRALDGRLSLYAIVKVRLNLSDRLTCCWQTLTMGIAGLSLKVMIKYFLPFLAYAEGSYVVKRVF